MYFTILPMAVIAPMRTCKLNKMRAMPSVSQPNRSWIPDGSTSARWLKSKGNTRKSHSEPTARAA